MLSYGRLTVDFGIVFAKTTIPKSPRLCKNHHLVSSPSPRLCKTNNSKINCESAIGQYLLTNPECARTYTDDNFRVIGQGRSSFHLSVLESVYIKTQNPVLCKQKVSSFLLESSSNNGNWANWPLLGPLRLI